MLVGWSENDSEKVCFTKLLAAGANSFRHLHEWEDLEFTNDYIVPVGKRERRRFELQMENINTIRQAFQDKEPIDSERTYEIVKLLSTSDLNVYPNTGAGDYGIFKPRLIESVRDLALQVGALTEFENAQTYHEERHPPRDLTDMSQ